MLPKLSGLEICREVRRDDSLNRLPILMLTARGDEADRVVGLEMGADDYVTKPFSPRELLARVKALIRRSEPPVDAPRTLEVGRLAIDPAAYRVSHSGKPVPLSTLEFRLLYYLASRPNRVFTRDQLVDAVWGTDRFVTPRSVDVYVRRLREKIESDPENPLHLKTVRGAGYLFEVDFLAERTLRSSYEANGYQELKALSTVIRQHPLPLGGVSPQTPEDSGALNTWVKDAAAGGTRVTVISAEGKVLADSESETQTMESHAERPEVREA